MKKCFARICCLVLLPLQLLCGQAPAPPAKKVAGRMAWVVATSIPEEVANPLPMLAGDKLHNVPLYLRSVDQGIPLDAPLDEAISVRAVKSETDKEGKVAYKNLSVCQIPAGVRQALIVLIPKDDDGDGLRFDSKVLDLSKFKKGGCLYINLVQTSIGITIGESKTTVKPGGMEFVNPLKEEKTEVMPVRFFYEVPADAESKAEWKLMTASRMAIYPSRREICIFFYNKEIENVDFRGIPFMTQPPQATPPKP